MGARQQDHETTGPLVHWTTRPRGLRDHRTTGQWTMRTKAEDEQARNSSDDFAEFAGFLLHRLDEPVQTAEGLLRITVKLLCFLCRQKPKPAREMDEILRFRQRAPRDVQEMQVVSLAFARRSLNNVRGHRVRRSPKLACQPVNFLPRKQSGSLVNCDRQIICQLPSVNFRIVPHGLVVL